jgi:sortase A
MRKLARVLGTLMVIGGVGACVWAVVVWRWQDPFTALYTTYEQHKLASRFEKQLESYRPVAQKPFAAAAAARPDSTNWVAAETRAVALEARRYRMSLKVGQPLGRIKVPRLGLNIIVVTGTDHDSLTKGPGWYTGTYLPGEHQLIYIAGHRTTYLAPFAHIDALRPGDKITMQLPYGTFVYRMGWHAIVPADDLSRLRSQGHELLVLQACHPRFFATHRYLAYAVPVRVIPRVGRPYTVPQKRAVAGARA